MFSMRLSEKKSRRQMILTVISSLSGDFGSSIFSFGLSFMLLARTGSVFSFALSTIISPIVGLVLLPFVGSIVDKTSRKKVILLSQLATVTALLIYWLSFPHIQHHLLAGSVLLIIVLRASDQFTMTARKAANVQLVQEEDLQKLSAYTQMTASASGIVSSIFGAFLYSFLPFELFFFIEIIAELLAGLIVLFLDFSFGAKLQQETSRRGNLAMFKEGLRYVSRQKFLLVCLVLALICNFFSGIYSVGVPFLVMKVFKLGQVNYGIADAMNGVGYIVGGFLIQKLPASKQPVYQVWQVSLMIGVLLAAIGGLPLLPLKGMLLQLLLNLVMFLVGVAYVFINVPYTVWLQQHLPVEMQGRVFGVLSMTGQTIMPLGVFLFGILFDLTGVEKELLAAAIFILSGITLTTCAFLTGKISRLPLKEAVIYPAEPDEEGLARMKREKTKHPANQS